MTIAEMIVPTWQQMAWTAAVLGVFVGLVQLLLGIWRQCREDRRKRVESGYLRLDAMFDDECASKILKELDRRHRTKRPAGMEIFDSDFARALDAGPVTNEPTVEGIQLNLDSLLYHFERFEHSLAQNLIAFDSISKPIGYYIGLLAEHKKGLVSYMTQAGFTTALVFCERFDSWRSPKTMETGSIN